MTRLGWVLAGWMFVSAAAQADDAYQWLQRMSHASKSQSFTGVFVYQSQGRTESSRIVRLVDGAGEHERLETLDGPPREVIRFNESVQCFLPDDKLLVLDRAILARQPGRLISKPAALAEFYDAHLIGAGRVAGRDAQVVKLSPRDGMRYGYQLWIDSATGILLKARLLAQDSAAVEQFAFTEINPGSEIDAERLRPRTVRTAGWRIVNAAGDDVRPEDIAWAFRRLPAGFKQVSLVRRTLHHDNVAAVHAAFSDGFANVSVFIEPLAARSVQNPSDIVSPVGMYRRVKGDSLITVMGEVPAAALRRFAESVERRK
ncbi:MAG: MucB/RseB C-terminal domain-containing protein [Candidatus Dactylopiibacterium sp.]|nr:MucB/RseB C-terminal domain-containing protein [Candidatus Dactylopiibacterium sp.]